MNYQKKLKQYQQKRLTKDLTDKFNILNGTKYFSLERFRVIQYYYQLKNTLIF